MGIFWSAVVFLAGVVSTKAVEFMFERYKERKSLDIRVNWGAHDVSRGQTFELRVKNTGAKKLGILAYGFRTWYGGGPDITTTNVVPGGEILEPEQREAVLPFFNSNIGMYMNPKEEEIYYYFVETGSKVFRKYTRPRLFAWLKRFRTKNTKV